MVRLLRSYEKQISINAMKKIGAPLLGLAKYIYIYIMCFRMLGLFSRLKKVFGVFFTFFMPANPAPYNGAPRLRSVLVVLFTILCSKTSSGHAICGIVRGARWGGG